MIKKADIIIFAFILLICAVGFLFINGNRNVGSRVTVSVDNEVVYDIPLNTDRVVALPKNTVSVINGEVFMEYSSCKNQICVKTAPIKNAGEKIICLPNKVIVEVVK